MTPDSHKGNLKRLTPHPRAFTESINHASSMANEPLASVCAAQTKSTTPHWFWCLLAFRVQTSWLRVPPIYPCSPWDLQSQGFVWAALSPTGSMTKISQRRSWNGIFDSDIRARDFEGQIYPLSRTRSPQCSQPCIMRPKENMHLFRSEILIVRRISSPDTPGFGKKNRHGGHERKINATGEDWLVWVEYLSNALIPWWKYAKQILYPGSCWRVPDTVLANSLRQNHTPQGFTKRTLKRLDFVIDNSVWQITFL